MRYALILVIASLTGCAHSIDCAGITRVDVDLEAGTATACAGKEYAVFDLGVFRDEDTLSATLHAKSVEAFEGQAIGADAVTQMTSDVVDAVTSAVEEIGR